MAKKNPSDFSGVIKITYIGDQTIQIYGNFVVFPL